MAEVSRQSYMHSVMRRGARPVGLSNEADAPVARRAAPPPAPAVHAHAPLPFGPTEAAPHEIEAVEIAGQGEQTRRDAWPAPRTEGRNLAGHDPGGREDTHPVARREDEPPTPTAPAAYGFADEGAHTSPLSSLSPQTADQEPRAVGMRSAETGSHAAEVVPAGASDGRPSTPGPQAPTRGGEGVAPLEVHVERGVGEAGPRTDRSVPELRITSQEEELQNFAHGTSRLKMLAELSSPYVEKQSARQQAPAPTRRETLAEVLNQRGADIADPSARRQPSSIHFQDLGQPVREADAGPPPKPGAFGAAVATPNARAQPAPSAAPPLPRQSGEQFARAAPPVQNAPPREESPRLLINRLDVQIVNQPPPPAAPPAPPPPVETGDGWDGLERQHLGRATLMV